MTKYQVRFMGSEEWISLAGATEEQVATRAMVLHDPKQRHPGKMRSSYDKRMWWTYRRHTPTVYVRETPAQ